MSVDLRTQVSIVDVVFFSGLLLILLVLTINVFVRSWSLVYVVILFVLGVLISLTKTHGRKNGVLKDLWLLALLSTVLYPFVDYFFVAALNLVEYATSDFRILVTPIYIILFWVFGVLLFGYFYHRVYAFIGRTWLAGLVTGVFAAASTTLVENLFNVMGFYRNAPSKYMIGYIPIYVPIGYILAFSLIPIYLRHKYVGGFLLYLFTGLSWYVAYTILSLFAF